MKVCAFGERGGDRLKSWFSQFEETVRRGWERGWVYIFITRSNLNEIGS
jgi:hypothetical protein